MFWSNFVEVFTHFAFFKADQMKISTFWRLRFFSKTGSQGVFILYFILWFYYNDNVLKAPFRA